MATKNNIISTKNFNDFINNPQIIDEIKNKAKDFNVEDNEGCSSKFSKTAKENAKEAAKQKSIDKSIASESAKDAAKEAAKQKAINKSNNV